MADAKEQVTRGTFLANQKKHCKDTGAPHFMPNDGTCFHCRRDIIPELILKGEDGSTLVTGCPLCNYSYCE